MDRLFSEPSYPRGVCHLPDILSQSLEPFISLCENDDFKQLAENLDLWITAWKYNVSEPPYLGPEDFFERLSAIDFTNQNIHSIQLPIK